MKPFTLNKITRKQIIGLGMYGTAWTFILSVPIGAYMIPLPKNNVPEAKETIEIQEGYPRFWSQTKDSYELKGLNKDKVKYIRPFMKRYNNEPAYDMWYNDYGHYSLLIWRQDRDGGQLYKTGVIQQAPSKEECVEIISH